MTPEHFQTFKTAITTAVEAYLARGGTIVNRVFEGGKGVCPIRALTKGSTNLSMFADQQVSLVLGFTITYGEVWAFIDGVDQMDYAGTEKDLFAFGEEIYNKFIQKH